MGEAKRRKEERARNPIVYHHTSTLRTNLIWMSGVIELEGRGDDALHPHFGVLSSNANLRREMRDFPPLAWFTTEINPPQCLVKAAVFGRHKETGEQIDLPGGKDLAKVVALNRVAIGFPLTAIPVSPWPEHAGYRTEEGASLNRSAREMGDNPDRWYVAEEPVDVMAATEFWAAPSVLSPKLKRHDAYVAEMKKMVETCRTTKGVYIPPSWLKPQQARQLVKKLAGDGVTLLNNAAGMAD